MAARKSVRSNSRNWKNLWGLTKHKRSHGPDPYYVKKQPRGFAGRAVKRDASAREKILKRLKLKSG